MRILFLLLIASCLPARLLASQFVFVDSFGSSGPVRLDNPSGVAVAQDGTLWVSDFGLGRVLHFTTTGTYLGEATPRPNAWMPTGVAVLANGQLVVAGGDVWLFNSDGTGGASLGQTGGCYGVVAKPDGGFLFTRQLAGELWSWPDWGGVYGAPGATGVALELSSYNSIYGVFFSTCQTPSRVRRHRALNTVEYSGTILGNFSTPMDVECMGDQVLIADTGNHRVLVMDSDMNYQTHFGTFGSGPGQMSRPSGLAVTPDGTVFVTDLDTNRVSRFVLAPTAAVPSSWGRIKSLVR